MLSREDFKPTATIDDADPPALLCSQSSNRQWSFLTISRLCNHSHFKSYHKKPAVTFRRDKILYEMQPSAVEMTQFCNSLCHIDFK